MPRFQIAALAALLLFSPPVEAKQHRSQSVLHQFQHEHPCPSTGLKTGPCKGWVKDHVRQLCAGGADAVDNLQWQTTKDAAAKDKLEWAECRALKKGSR